MSIHMKLSTIPFAACVPVVYFSVAQGHDHARLSSAKGTKWVTSYSKGLRKTCDQDNCPSDQS